MAKAPRVNGEFNWRAVVAAGESLNLLASNWAQSSLCKAHYALSLALLKRLLLLELHEVIILFQQLRKTPNAPHGKSYERPARQHDGSGGGDDDESRPAR